MSKVTDLTDVEVRVVSETHKIDEIRWFQTQRYFETGLLSHLPDDLPPDPSVDFSTYFAAYSPQGQIQACTRLIHPAAGLPLLQHHELYPVSHDRLLDNAGRIAEVSRLAVAQNAPHYRALGLMARELFRHTLRNQDSTALLASIEVPLIRILEHVLGIPVEVVGPEIPQYGDFAGACVPVLIDTVRYLTEARWRDTRRWAFFTEGLVIDITDGRLSSSDPALTKAS